MLISLNNLPKSGSLKYYDEPKSVIDIYLDEHENLKVILEWNERPDGT